MNLKLSKPTKLDWIALCIFLACVASLVSFVYNLSRAARWKSVKPYMYREISADIIDPLENRYNLTDMERKYGVYTVELPPDDTIVLSIRLEPKDGEQAFLIARDVYELKRKSPVLSRKPMELKIRVRDPKDGIFAGGMGVDILYQGCLVALLTIAAFFIGHYMETGAFEITNSIVGTTMAFITMSMAEVFHSFNMRSQRGSTFTIGNVNRMLIFAGAVSFVCTAAVVLVPFLANAFGFAQLTVSQYAAAIGLAVCVIPIVEIVKFFQRKAAKTVD